MGKGVLALPRLLACARPLVSSDSHADFQPVVKAGPSAEALAEARARIEAELTRSKVVVFMKGTPDAPQCGFSNRVVQVLRAEGVEEYGAVNVLEDAAVREGIKAFTGYPTIPQVFVGKEGFIGGSDIVFEMYEDGSLGKLLEKEGAVKASEGEK
jgi:monothiol glutaredoxin